MNYEIGLLRNKKLVFLLLVIACRVLMDLTYELSVSPYFDYARLVNNQTIESTILSWFVLSILTYFALPFVEDENDEFVSSIVIMLFIIRVISFSSYIRYSPQPLAYVILNLIYWIWLFILLNNHSSDNLINFKVHKSEKLIHFIAFASALTVILVSGLYANFRFHFTFDDVYELREEAREFSMPSLFAYFYSATGNVIPILVVFYILSKKYTYVLLLVFIGVLNFGIAGQKATIFKIFACVAMIYMVRINLRRILLPFTIFLLLLILGAVVIFDDTVLSWMIVRRVFYIPNMIDTIYYDYISDSYPLFFDTQASGDLAFEISDIYMNRPESRSNNGMFSDAYTNLGFVGVLVLPIILNVVIKAFSKALEGQHKSIVVFSSIIIATTLHSSFISRCLLTHGFIIMFFVLYFMPNNAEELTSEEVVADEEELVTDEDV